MSTLRRGGGGGGGGGDRGGPRGTEGLIEILGHSFEAPSASSYYALLENHPKNEDNSSIVPDQEGYDFLRCYSASSSFTRRRMCLGFRVFSPWLDQAPPFAAFRLGCEVLVKWFCGLGFGA